MAKKVDLNNLDDLTLYYKKIYQAIDEQTQSDAYGSYILSRVKGGQKTVFNKTLTEIRNFDMSFLDTIESVYPAMLKIMRNPKKTIRYDEEVVAVEKAKKVNSQTVRHLSSHTQLIKEIKRNGDVIPSKVLTTFAEEELAIYENRFLKSLVKRCEMFLERRYEVMKISLSSFETNRLSVENKFLLSGQEVTMNIDVEIKDDLTVNAEQTREQFNRLLNIREMIQGLKGTEFMRTLAKARDVVPPIMKTNILMHNPDFKLCFGLWLYLDKVDSIATNVESKEKVYKYTQIIDKDINDLMTMTLISFIKNRQIEGIYSSKKLGIVKAPKVQEKEDIVLEPSLAADNKKLEDYTMNEILLDQTAKYFEASFDGIQRTGTPYNESIRVVYRQMLDMLDQIYRRAFGVADDELESKDLYEQLEFARRRMLVMKAVKQQKTMNIARMGKEEKRVEKLVETLEKKIKLKEAQERAREEKQRAKEEALRLQAIEKEKAAEERRRRLEKEALAKAKEAEKRRLDKAKAKLKEDAKKARARERAKELAAKKREYMKTSKRRNIRPRKKVTVQYADEMINDVVMDSSVEAAPAPKAKPIPKAAQPVVSEEDEFLAAVFQIKEASQEAKEEAPQEVIEEAKAPSEEDEFLAAISQIEEAPKAKPVLGRKPMARSTQEAVAPQEEEEEIIIEEIVEEAPQEENAPNEEDEFLAAISQIEEAPLDAPKKKPLLARKPMSHTQQEVEAPQPEDEEDEFLKAISQIEEVSADQPREKRMLTRKPMAKANPDEALASAEDEEEIILEEI